MGGVAFAFFDMVSDDSGFAQSSGDEDSRASSGSFRNALRVAVDEGVRATQPQERLWKLYLLLLWMFLHRRPERGGSMHKLKLGQRLDDFALGHWLDLLAASEKHDEDAPTAHNRGEEETESG